MATEYVIVSAGSAGRVSAARVTAAWRSVRPLEAGEPDDDRRIRVPAAVPKLMETAHDWAYRTTPRPELDAVTGALATRMTFTDGRATGVRFRKNGRTHHAAADREAILTAGAVNSPQLLSGVGDPAHLADHGIETRAVIPAVGRDLQNHLFATTVYGCTEPITRDDVDTLWNRLRWLLGKRGPLTANLAEAGGFVHTDRADEGGPGDDATGRGRPPPLRHHFPPAYLMDHTRKPGRSRVHARRHPTAGESGSCPTPVGRPDGRAGRRSALPDERAGSVRARRRGPAVTGDSPQ